MKGIKTDWSKIKPNIWHCYAYNDRLYLFKSPSGKTHIAKLIGDDETTFRYGSNYIFTTLCNRTFKQHNDDGKNTGWTRPAPFYSIHHRTPDGFLGVTCPRCAKLEPEFRAPHIEIDSRPHESELCRDESIWAHDHDLWTSKVVPQVLHDPERRCETCDKTCPQDDIEARRKDVVIAWHHGYQPRACGSWIAGIYSERQKAFRLTDEQLKNLSKYRLNLIYDHLTTTAWEHEVHTSFQARVLKVLKDSEGELENDDEDDEEEEEE